MSSIRGSEGFGRVEFKPDLSTVKDALRGFAIRAKDLTTPNARVATMLDRWGQENFKSQGGKVGGWQAFKIGGRRVKGGGIDANAKLLQDTGALRASFHAAFSAREVSYGSDLFYSEFHEFGTGTIPARRMLPHQDDVNLQILGIYNEWVEEITGERIF